MNVLYINPNKTEYYQLTDKNGTPFWLNWSAWIKATTIDSLESIKLLPKNIADLIPKWTEKLEITKSIYEDKDDCPIKLVSIYFIYDDIVYKLTPDAFSEEYMTRYYFREIHTNIENDLQDIGCIFTEYRDELD